MYMPPNNGGDFELSPAGTHLAICYRVIDLGTQKVDWQGKTKEQRKVMLSWELPDEKMSDGRPFAISQRYTFSSSEKAIFRQHLESWRGAPFKDSDFGPGGFDIRNILGKPCLLTVVHAEKGGRTYANIKGVAKPMKGTVAPDPVNVPVFFSLEPGEFNAELYETLSDGLKEVISKSPEFLKATGAWTEPPDQGHHDELDDEIPF